MVKVPQQKNFNKNNKNNKTKVMRSKDLNQIVRKNRKYRRKDNRI